LRGVGGGGGI